MGAQHFPIPGWIVFIMIVLVFGFLAYVAYSLLSKEDRNASKKERKSGGKKGRRSNKAD